MLLGIVFLAAIALLIGISYFWLDLGPLVWIEYALFPIAAEFLHVGHKVGEWFHSFLAFLRSPEPVSAGSAP